MGEVAASFAGSDRAPSRTEATTRARILVVDDDDTARAALDKLLRADGFATSTARDGEEGLAEAKRAPPDLVLTDLQMPRMDGVELCKRLHELDRDVPVIVMTAHSDMQAVIETLRAGAEDYLIKPLEYDAVLWCVQRALGRRDAELEKARLRHHTEELYRTINERLVLSSIQEREHADAEAEHRAQLDALLGNLGEGVVIAGRDGRLRMINHAARAILGLGEDDRCTVDAFHAEEVRDLDGQPLPSGRRPLLRALAGEQFAEYEVLQVRPGGDSRRVAFTGTNVRDASGEVALAFVVFRDVTELRRLEEQREEYLSLISHDLRNPLGSILTCVFMLKQSLEAKGLASDVNLAERAERNVKRMTGMLEELTEATTLESHGVALQRVACDLREVVASAADSVDDDRARRITIETDDTSSYVVLGDASRLERVVANLLTNALKYSAGDTRVIARLAHGRDTVELEVIDRGIGIAPESVEMLFDRYYRATAGKARAGGLGLGLYIARLIVEAHHGRIDVCSEVGKGSTFQLVLPSHSAPA